MIIVLDYEQTNNQILNTKAFDYFLAIKAEIQERLIPLRHEVSLIDTIIIIAIKPIDPPIKIHVLQNDVHFKLKILELLEGFDFEKVLINKNQDIFN